MSRLRELFATFRGSRELHLNIIGRKRWWFALSGTLMLVSAVGLFTPGLTLSIDFEGGARMSYETDGSVTSDDVERVLLGVREELAREATVQIVEGDQVEVRLPELSDRDRDELAEALAEDAGIAADQVNVEKVSPTWGAQISRKALQGLVIFLILVTIYISFRFEWKMAVGALATLVHDLLISAGVYALVGREVTPETVIAILTIMGFSLYDTVVIFDKIKENTENLALVSRIGYSEAVNLSVNQVFWRSVNTSVTTLFPILALLLFGGDTLKDFAFALFVGIFLGAYSSPFLAAPLLAVLKEREPRYRTIRERLTRPGRSLRPASPGDGKAAELQPAAVSASRPAPASTARPSSGSRRSGSRKKKKPRRR